MVFKCLFFSPFCDSFKIITFLSDFKIFNGFFETHFLKKLWFILFSVFITFWNENDDEIKEEYISTQYPNPADIEKTLEMNGLINNCKCYGGAFDYFEVTKVERLVLAEEDDRTPSP